MSGALLVTDLHLGDTTHDGGLGFREEEACRVCAAIVKQARDNEVKVVAFIGDNFHSKKPAMWAIRTFNEMVVALRAFCEVRVLDGNHDADGTGAIGPLSLAFLTDDERVNMPRTEQFGRQQGSTMFQFLMLPWFSRAGFSAMSPGTPANLQFAQMGAVFGELVAAKSATLLDDCPTVTLTHFTIAGVKYDSEDQPLLGDSTEFMAPRTAFNVRCGRVMVGHIHTPQVLPHFEGLADVEYIGSAIHHGFSVNESYDCASVLWDVDAGTFTRLPLPAIRFVTIEVGTEIVWQSSASKHRVDGAIVRLKGEMHAGPETAALIASWTEQVLAAGALLVAPAAITYARHEHREVSTITVKTDPRDALVEYIEVVGGDMTERKDAMLEVHARLIEEVRG